MCYMFTIIRKIYYYKKYNYEVVEFFSERNVYSNYIILN